VLWVVISEYNMKSNTKQKPSAATLTKVYKDGTKFDNTELVQTHIKRIWAIITGKTNFLEHHYEILDQTANSHLDFFKEQVSNLLKTRNDKLMGPYNVMKNTENVWPIKTKINALTASGRLPTLNDQEKKHESLLRGFFDFHINGNDVNYVNVFSQETIQKYVQEVFPNIKFLPTGYTFPSLASAYHNQTTTNNNINEIIKNSIRCRTLYSEYMFEIRQIVISALKQKKDNPSIENIKKQLLPNLITTYTAYMYVLIVLLEFEILIRDNEFRNTYISKIDSEQKKNDIINKLSIEPPDNVLPTEDSRIMNVVFNIRNLIKNHIALTLNKVRVMVSVRVTNREYSKWMTITTSSEESSSSIKIINPAVLTVNKLDYISLTNDDGDLVKRVFTDFMNPNSLIKQNVVCFLYGYSGTGKTTTLHNLLNNIDKTSNKFNLTWYKDKVVEGAKDITITPITEEKLPSLTVEGVKSRISPSVDYTGKTDEKRLYCYTPNNHVSSRAFTVVEVEQNSRSNGRIILIDMAGMEDEKFFRNMLLPTYDASIPMQPDDQHHSIHNIHECDAVYKVLVDTIASNVKEMLNTLRRIANQIIKANEYAKKGTLSITSNEQFQYKAAVYFYAKHNRLSALHNSNKFGMLKFFVTNDILFHGKTYDSWTTSLHFKDLNLYDATKTDVNDQYKSVVSYILTHENNFMQNIGAICLDILVEKVTVKTKTDYNKVINQTVNQVTKLYLKNAYHYILYILLDKMQSLSETHQGILGKFDTMFKELYIYITSYLIQEYHQLILDIIYPIKLYRKREQGTPSTQKTQNKQEPEPEPYNDDMLKIIQDMIGKKIIPVIKFHQKMKIQAESLHKIFSGVIKKDKYIAECIEKIKKGVNESIYNAGEKNNTEVLSYLLFAFNVVNNLENSKADKSVLDIVSIEDNTNDKTIKNRIILTIETMFSDVVRVTQDNLLTLNIIKSSKSSKSLDEIDLETIGRLLQQNKNFQKIVHGRKAYVDNQDVYYPPYYVHLLFEEAKAIKKTNEAIKQYLLTKSNPSDTSTKTVDASANGNDKSTKFALVKFLEEIESPTLYTMIAHIRTDDDLPQQHGVINTLEFVNKIKL
jgi:hypothetical protein